MAAPAIPRRWFIVGLVTFTLFVTAPHVATAQDRPGLAVDVSAGWVGFADDGIVNESLLGGSARWYLFPRTSIGPEIVYLSGDHHSHVVITGNITWDMFAPVNGRPARVTPFFVAGGGVFQTREVFFTGTFTSNEGTFTAGGGVRAHVGNRATFGVDARVGWELHLRISGLVGFRFGG
jgi:hypothetical protein